MRGRCAAAIKLLQQQRIRVFYGTETGTAEEFATDLVKKLETHFRASVDMMVYYPQSHSVTRKCRTCDT